MRRCNSCELTKPLTDFCRIYTKRKEVYIYNIKVSTKERYHSMCRKCNNIRTQLWKSKMKYKNTREKSYRILLRYQHIIITLNDGEKMIITNRVGQSDRNKLIMDGYWFIFRKNEKRDETKSEKKIEKEPTTG